MKLKVTATEARNRMGELINMVHFQGLEVIITKMDKPVARIVPYAKREDKK